MKKKMIIYGIIFLILQLIKSSFIAGYRADYGGSRIEMLMTSPGTVSYKEVKASGTYEKYLPVLMTQKRDVVSRISEPVMLIGTTSNYGQVEHLQMVSGAFFTHRAVDEGSNVIVISSELALKLFGSTKATGNRLRLNEKSYEIVGVYKKYKRIRDHISDDGCERIYVPVTLEVMKEQNIEGVIIDGDILEQMPDDRALAEMGFGKETSMKWDHSKWMKESKSMSQMPIMILNMVSIILMGKVLCKATRSRFYVDRSIKDRQSTDRPSTDRQITDRSSIDRPSIDRLIKNKPIGSRTVSLYKRLKSKSQQKQYISIMIGIGVAFLYCLWIVISLKCTHVYMDVNRLPSENLFDMKFYWKLLCEDWIKDNLFIRSGMCCFGRRLLLLKRSLHGINVVQYILLVKMLTALKTDAGVGQKEHSRNIEEVQRKYSKDIAKV